MGLSRRFMVDLPTGGYFVRRSGKYPYVHKVLRTYRNIKGQPTNDSVIIGKLDIETGSLIPNDNYWKYYPDTELAKEISADLQVMENNFVSKSIGVSFVVMKLLESSGVFSILKEIFGDEKANEILTAVTHIVDEGNVFQFVDYWYSEHMIRGALLTSETSSVLFASITLSERLTFFRRWIGLQQLNDDYIAYDVTSFSTYSKNISDAGFGYNRDGDDMPQINMGCYFGEKCGLPLFYVTYPGPITDKTHLPNMMAYNVDLGISNPKFVMDKGFCSTANLAYMHSKKYDFLMAVENRNKSVSAAIDSVRDGIKSMENRIKDGVYAAATHGKYYGIHANLHIYYQPAMEEQQRGAWSRKLEQYESELSAHKTLTAKQVKLYSHYFDITVAENGSFTYAKNYTLINEKVKNCGYFCLIASFGVSSKEALEIYRNKDVIEKNFDDIKNHADMKRLRTHSDATTDGKVFCAFLSLIAIYLFKNCLNASKDLKTAQNEALIELSKIKLLITGDGKRSMNPLTKKERLILESCGITEQDLSDFVLSV